MTNETLGGVRARMYCPQVIRHDSGYTTIKLTAIYSKGEGNKDFNDATPSGTLEMVISKGRPAAAFFEPGKTYDLLFTPLEQ